MSQILTPVEYTFDGSADLFDGNIANNEGVLSYILDDDSVTSQYIPLFQNHERQVISLFNELVLYYGPEALDGIEWFRVNRPGKVAYTKTLDNFHFMDKNSLSEVFVKDKIVIMRWLGPGASLHRIRIGERILETYSPVVTANIVLNILVDLDRNPHMIEID